jgi:protein-S-isoprenylcysteine O-methyltransferase Ste14
MTATEPTPAATPAPAAPSASAASRRRAVIEWGEWGVILALYSWLVARLWVGLWYEGKVVNLLLLASEGLVVGFVLFRRRAGTLSARPTEWLLAFAVTCAPMLVVPGGEPLVPPLAAVALLVVGLVIQLHAKIVLGRSIGMIPANRGLKLGGPYRFVRHPMYAGYLIGHVAFLLANPTWWNLAVYGIGNALQVMRLLAEERLLAADERYREYQGRVRYRLIPLLF